MFAPATFDPANAPVQDTLVFDQNGIISSTYPYSGTPASNGDTPAWVLSWLGGGLYSAGYLAAADYPAWEAKYFGATFHEGQNYAFTQVDGNGGSTTTYLIDNGIQGTSGMDVIFDISGNNIIDAGAGDDLVMVGWGDDAVAGGDGNDEIYTSVGNDIVDAGDGDDVVYLFGDNDLARGGKGNDRLFGEDGDDKLWGQQGDDLLDGGAGADILRGGGGKDTVLGGAGDDMLWGNGGHDMLHGGEGTDIMTGGNGRDTFVFNLGDDQDTITDFDTAKDTIELDLALGITSFADLQAISTQNGADITFDFGNGDTLTLEDTSWSDLSANDFDFV